MLYRACRPPASAEEPTVTKAPADAVERQAIFITHANPEDNSFALWLGAKLSVLGYEVWADILRLHGGDDWQRKLERALRVRAHKVVVVANARAVKKQGVRNEIQIASEVGKKIGDDEFIVPLRLGPFEAPFLIAHRQYIDFETGWARGLAELLDTLRAFGTPRIRDAGGDLWRQIQLQNSRHLAPVPESLVSNWLRIADTPATIKHYDFDAAISIDSAQARKERAPWPLAPFRRGFLSFASIEDLQGHFGSTLPLAVREERNVGAFLDFGWPELHVDRRAARNLFSDLGRQTMERLFQDRGLVPYTLASGRLAWWAPRDGAPTELVSFRWGDVAGKRQLQGTSVRRSMHWHYGVSTSVRSRPFPHVRLISRLVFTSDGRQPFDDARRMHRTRRSFARSWRNARWRDMLLALLHILSNGRDAIRAPVGTACDLVLELPPLSWVAPVSTPAAADTSRLDGEDAPEKDDDDFWWPDDSQFDDADEDDD